LARANGDLLRATGYGLEELDVRELCDLAYSSIIESMEKQYYAQLAAGGKWENSDNPLEDSIVRFEERAGLRENPEEIALELHKRFLADQGKEWDDTPVSAGSGQWWDQDVEFTDMADLDQQARRREASSVTRGLFARERKVKEQP
jgi:hypothetical protein